MEIIKDKPYYEMKQCGGWNNFDLLIYTLIFNFMPVSFKEFNGSTSLTFPSYIQYKLWHKIQLLSYTLVL